MSVWTVGKNERFHNKKFCVQHTDDGRETALSIECSSEIYARTNETWVPDTKRGYGMKREKPITRFSAVLVVAAGCHGCPDRVTPLFSAWTEKPQPEDARAFAQYSWDEKQPGFLGICASSSPVRTAVKKYMQEH